MRQTVTKIQERINVLKKLFEALISFVLISLQCKEDVNQCVYLKQFAVPLYLECSDALSDYLALNIWETLNNKGAFQSKGLIRLSNLYETGTIMINLCGGLVMSNLLENIFRKSYSEYSINISIIFDNSNIIYVIQYFLIFICNASKYMICKKSTLFLLNPAQLLLQKITFFSYGFFNITTFLLNIIFGGFAHLG